MNSTAEIISRLENKTAVVGIMVLGYVGLPPAVRLNEVGYTVLGFDIANRRRRGALRSRGHHG